MAVPNTANSYVNNFFDIIQFFGDLITNNVNDIKTDRGNQRWVYPTFPEDKSNLPQVMIKWVNVEYENNAAYNILETKTISPILVEEYYSKKAIGTLNFVVFSNKDAQLVTTFNEQEIALNNTNLNMFIANEIKQCLIANKAETDARFTKFDVQSIEPSHDTDKYMIQSIITTRVVYRDVWVKSIGPEGIINDYTLNLALI